MTAGSESQISATDKTNHPLTGQNSTSSQQLLVFSRKRLTSLFVVDFAEIL